MSILSSLLSLISSPPQVPFDDFYDRGPLQTYPDFRTQVALDPFIPDNPNEVRSWLGGRPTLPKEVDWPMIEGRAAVFLAQISCRDLPRGIWGGIGPRRGWLLVFLDTEFKGLRVLHTPSRGALRYDAAGVMETFFTYGENRRDPQAGPLFPRMPVRPRAISDATSDVSSPAPDPTVPIRPRTVGGLRASLDFILERVRELDANSIREQFDHHVRRATVEDEPLFQDALERSLRSVQRIIDHNHALKDRLVALLHPFTDAPERTVLPDGIWEDFVAAVTAETVAVIRWRETRQAILGQAEALPVLYTPMFRPAVTVGALRTELNARRSWFRGFRHFETERNLSKMRREAETPRPDQPGVQERWKERVAQADLKAGWMAADKKSRESVAAIEQALYASLSDQEEEALADRKLQDRLIVEDRRCPALAKWMHTIKPDVPGISEVDVAFEPLGENFTLEGVVPKESARSLHAVIVRNELDRFEAGELSKPEIADLRRQILPGGEGGYLMGGLSPWGWEDLNLMGVASYLSEKGRVPMKERSHLEKYIEDEPEVLLLHLRTDRIMGWMWGDTYTLAIFVPRDDFSRGVFDRAHLIITNG